MTTKPDRQFSRKHPCAECPFSRDVEPGGTGGADPTVYVGQAAGPFWLPCHMDPGYGKNKLDTSMMQCAGAAMFRASLGVAPRMPLQLHALEPTGEAFESPEELIAHHLQISRAEALKMLEETPVEELLKKEFLKLRPEMILHLKKKG